MTQETKVTQADREAAAFALESICPPAGAHGTAWYHSRARMIRGGEVDGHPMVQAFARHRLASTEAADALLRDVRQYFLEMAGCDPHEADDALDYDEYELFDRIDTHLKGASHEQG